MAKITLTFEDDFKDGQPTVRGKFTADGAPEGVGGLPGVTTPAMMFGATIHRLWNRGIVGGLATLVCPDIVYNNDMIAQALARANGTAPLQGLPAPPPGDVKEALPLAGDAPNDKAPTGTVVEATGTLRPPIAS